MMMKKNITFPVIKSQLFRMRDVLMILSAMHFDETCTEESIATTNLHKQSQSSFMSRKKTQHNCYKRREKNFFMLAAFYCSARSSDVRISSSIFYLLGILD